MKKENIIKTVLIILGIIVLFSVYGYWSAKRYEAQKKFFVSSCIETMYDDNSYYLNKIIGSFVKEIPTRMKDYIEDSYGDDYMAVIDNESSTERLCEDIFVYYREALEEEEGRYDYCESNRCR